MTSQIIDGKAIAQKVRNELSVEIQSLKTQHIQTPGLAVVLVGNNPASQVYVRNKIAACKEVGIESFYHPLPENTTETELLALIDQLNANSKVHGILVQLPLPAHLSAKTILERLDPTKDVDGLTAHSLGRLAEGDPTYTPCTPAGVMRLLDEIDFDCQGKHAVVIGRSNIVGKPMGLLLLARHATVTFCHSKTKDLPNYLKQADLVVAAIGAGQFVKGEWLKPGSVVIDVGMNRNTAGKLVGDVDFESAASVASWITPVPGGVGPMTIAMLLKNTVEGFKKYTISR